MGTVEERLAFLEGRVGEHSQMLTGIREAMVSLEQRMDRRFEAVELRLTALDQKLDRSVTALDQKLDHRFSWLLGVQVTTLIAIVAALLTR
jgi:uncharacterized coiled-coil protein SlyX